MREVLESILAVERDARLRLDEAVKRASARRAEADSLAERFVAEAAEQAAGETRRLVGEAVARAERRRAEGVAEIDAGIARRYGALEALCPVLAREAVELASASPLERRD